MKPVLVLFAIFAVAFAVPRPEAESNADAAAEAEAEAEAEAFLDLFGGLGSAAGGLTGIGGSAINGIADG